MKDRHWTCYLLDAIGITAILCAMMALAAASWFAGSIPEAMLLAAFARCFSIGVGALLAARVVDIAGVVVAHQRAAPVVSDFDADENVETLPAPNRLSRAA